MKHKKFCLAFLLAFSLTSFAANSPQRERWLSLTGRPLEVFLVALNGELAIKVHEQIAVIVPLYVQLPGKKAIPTLLDAIAIERDRPFSLLTGVGARFYVSNVIFQNGFYVEPIFQMGYVYQKSFTLNPIVKGGYEWIFDSHFTINVAGGIQLVKQWGDRETNVEFKPDIDFSLGYTW